MNDPVRVVSVSGGKDSTAMYLLAMDRHDDGFSPVFADTGHEHEWTLEFIALLHERTGGPKVRVVREDFADKFPAKRRTISEKWPAEGVSDDIVRRALDACQPTGIPFLDLCLLRGGFPSRWQRFCTDRLKIRPIMRDVFLPILQSGRDVESWQGIRRDESLPRRDLAERQPVRTPREAPSGRRVDVYRPLLDWDVADVWRMHRRHGIEPNPLYAQGADRVGCMPCIFANKRGLRVVAERHHEHVERVAEWERLVGLASKSRLVKATYFPIKAVGGHGIHAAAEWAGTSRGGREMDLIPLEPVLEDLTTDCAAWGACE